MSLKFCLVDESFKLVTGERRFVNTDRLFDAQPEIRLVAGKRDWVAFQVLLKADEDYCVNVGKAAWFSQKGQLLNARIEVCAPFPAKASLIGMLEDDDLYKRADILLTHSVIETVKNTPQAVWVEIAVPEDAKAGKYEGEVVIYQNRMFGSEERAGKLPFEFEVKDFTMPKPQEYKFHLDLWQHGSNIARKHEVELWSEEHFEVLESYVKSLADLGQKAVTIVASEIPWRGQSCYLEDRTPSNLFEYSMIDISRETDGSFRYDFSAMQKYIDLCFRYGIDREIEVFGLVNIWTDEKNGYGKISPDYPDGISLRYRDLSDGCYKYISEGRDIDAYIKALEQYFIDQGLIDKVRIVADEPGDINAYRKSVERVMSAAPSFKFKTAINHAEFIGEFGKEISDFVPFINCLIKEWDKIQEYKAKLADKRYLWYVCCGPSHPNTFIRSNLLESRFIGVLTSYLGLDGFLRWNYTVWPEEPRKSIRYALFPAGDTNFVYPSNNGTPLLTLRYKNLKRGIEDYELFRLLREKGMDEAMQKAYARILVEKDITKFIKENGYELIPVQRMCSLEYGDYASAREIMLDALSDVHENRG